ncbi:MAG: hypothetical protein F6K24_01500 [Okeania sp. SIO2D1]|nr:hypothetical protein [Okeania sp. SIO2D1]
MSSATQTINYFLSHKPTENDQLRLNVIDSKLDELPQAELIQLLGEFLFTMADGVESKTLTETFEEMEAVDEIHNLAMIKAIVSRLKDR